MSGRWLFAACRPWLVAVPLEGLARLVSDDEVMLSEMTLTTGDATWPRCELSTLLHGDHRPSTAHVLLLVPRLAIGVERCLAIGPLPGAGAVMLLPGACQRSGRQLSVFPAEAMASAHGLAPFGLILDRHLLSGVP